MRRSLDMLHGVPERLRTQQGPQYWRTLSEYADSPDFRELVEREFPDQAGVLADPLSRRQFLTVMGASLALAGVTGCSTQPPQETIVPYVRPPEALTPGKPMQFATAMSRAGQVIGLLVTSHQGRPTRVDGNPEHPASLGATDRFAQASVLSLYDPDRSQSIRYLDRIRTWNEVSAEIARLIDAPGGLKATKGKGFRVLSEAITSPTVLAARAAFLKAYPEARWYIYEPAVSGSANEGTRLLFGEPLDPQYRFSEAVIVLTLDADPLTEGSGHLRYAREFMQRRRRLVAGEMNRLYAVESTPGSSGMLADHRWPVRAAQVETVARALAARLGLTSETVELPAKFSAWLDAVANDLKAHAGKFVIVPGEHQPPTVHALAHAMNEKFGNVGKTVVYTKPVVDAPRPSIDSLKELCSEIDAGQVKHLFILGGNPVFSAPVDFDFAARVQKVPQRFHLGYYEDETSRLCQWHIPQAHYLETWGDEQAHDGTCSIVQPLIAPLFGGKSTLDILSRFAEVPGKTPYELVREHWQGRHRARSGKETFEQFWRKCVHDGVVPGTALQAVGVKVDEAWKTAVTRQKFEPFTESQGESLELIFRPDPTIFDGRYINNGWLQELPKPLSKLTWDNALLVSPLRARQLGVKNTLGPNGGSHGQTIADTVDLTFSIAGKNYELKNLPVLILPGHPDASATLHYGYGRADAGKVGSNTGYNAFAIRTSQAPLFVSDVKLTRAARKVTLACTQAHHMIKSEEAFVRGTVRVGTLAEYAKHPDFALTQHPHHNGPLPVVGGLPQKTRSGAQLTTGQPLDILPEEYPYDGYKWGMVIDLNSCTGCSACVVACQSENSIPVVGKDQVTRGREMHWLRIDQYHSGDPEHSESIHTVLQPLMCVHCENAPCEVVCPVEATSHSPDGLNEMTYNRCVGTRYCSNNCPYKVRRFNFFQYTDYATESLKLQRNPEVTVRTRGVMEKCTFCVQRIRSAEIQAKNANRYGADPSRPAVAYIPDGEVVTACQAACPTQAIVFGDMNDVEIDPATKAIKPRSKVSQLKVDPRQYGLLSELNTRPRLTYLAAVRNPNPVLESKDERHGH